MSLDRLSWDVHGEFMALSWDFHGGAWAFTVHSWCLHNAPNVLSWTFMMPSWCSHELVWFSWRIRGAFIDFHRLP